jgi:L-amino acid N-acyltransferase YncA
MTAAIRTAAPADAPSVCAIYNHGIAERQATFETTPRVPADVEAWFVDGLPFVVAVEADGRVLGFARVSSYSDRCVYDGVGEHAVYVDPEARGLTSRVFTTNAPSLAAHRSAGFYEVGVQLSHGRLDGEWKDCVLVERLLGPAKRRPSGP